MKYQKSTPVSLKAHAAFNEKWLQQQIVDDVTLLGLGDLDVKDVERRQPHAGRLDLLLFDAVANTRYEVEIQLGATDESHIIRTLEYWDNERRRFPQYEHIAVIVAEEVTGRFINVINLFNQAIPLIAIQLAALDVGGVMTLNATRVLDLALPAPEEDDDSGRETNRDYWVSRGSSETVKLVDQMLELVNEHGATMSLKYNRYYIGLQRDGMVDNFISFRPRKKHLICEFRLDQSGEADNLIEEAGLTAITYDKRWKRYRVQLQPADFVDADKNGAIRVLIGQARGLTEDVATDSSPA